MLSLPYHLWHWNNVHKKENEHVAMRIRRLTLLKLSNDLCGYGNNPFFEDQTHLFVWVNYNGFADIQGKV